MFRNYNTGEEQFTFLTCKILVNQACNGAES